MNVLFVCSRNKWRSPTAEKLFDGRDGLSARSAGTAASARIKVTEKLIRWADVILAMEKEHKARLIENFGPALDGKPIEILDIEDDYRYMDPELIAMLESTVTTVLRKYEAP